MFEMVQNQDDNPYKKVVLNKVFREKDKSPEMRNWSIFSNNIRYIQHEQKTPPKLDIDTLDYRHHKELYFKLKEEERETLDIDFGMYPYVLRSKYLDMCMKTYMPEMVYTNKFNGNSDLSTTYLGQAKMTRDTKIKAEERLSYYQSRICFRKITGWHRMSNLVGHGCHKILHVKVLLFAIQNSTYISKIFF